MVAAVPYKTAPHAFGFSKTRRALMEVPAARFALAHAEAGVVVESRTEFLHLASGDWAGGTGE
jgi:hypothetical protein